MIKLVKNIPNALTFLRLLLVPFFVYLMIDPSRLMLNWAAGIFIFASITDYLDGFIARRFKAVSQTGKLLDPLADKILVMSALVMLVAQRSDIDGEPWVSGWLVVIILAREMWVTGLRGIAASGGVVIAAQSGGKWKNALQLIAISVLIIHYPLNLGGYLIDLQLLGTNILILSVGFSLWSAGEYTAQILGKKPKA